MAVAMPPEGLRFLADLQRHNDKAWFEQNRAVYVDAVKEPWLDVVDAISERLAEFAPAYVRPAAQAVMRIHRDVRFSKDKTPYNPRVAAVWARSGLDKFGAASFYLAVTPSGVEVGAGSYAPSTAQLAAIRDHLLLHHGDARRALDRTSSTPRRIASVSTRRSSSGSTCRSPRWHRPPAADGQWRAVRAG